MAAQHWLTKNLTSCNRRQKDCINPDRPECFCESKNVSKEKGFLFDIVYSQKLIFVPLPIRYISSFFYEKLRNTQGDRDGVNSVLKYNSIFGQQAKTTHLNKQGSAMLMVLGLLTFILALGAIVFRSAQMREELARERYAYRSTMNILESMTSAACAAGSSSWRTVMKDHPDVTDVGSYDLTVKGVAYHLEVVVEKGDVLVRAFCDGKHGAPIVLTTRLSFDDTRAVIREQKRTL